MKTDHYCNRADEESHICTMCEYCYCKDTYINEDYEPSDAEIETMIEREIARSEAIYDSM